MKQKAKSLSLCVWVFFYLPVIVDYKKIINRNTENIFLVITTFERRGLLKYE